ncbi:MAG: hypothetical protein A2622_14215 [Bdellovibrionales bacterium RIFCSPHIGHO2_01_FULL_40_29]|nr:MAG: hypothetical protein A2622_14215 [Bdellovibrionales bacterium RIFCSPHIGHO2_01_FULL_40_29]OFZ33676.1 MAG: hypothetical protein A3D17_11825 [Bdellovibrionales bacterium RIFCSPHIGHO2_02_FULL_40_15]
MPLSIFLLLFSMTVSAFAQNLKTPNISANALFLYRNSNFHREDLDPVNPDQDRNGFNLREAEFQFDADVDPYTRMTLLLAIHSSYDASGGAVEEVWTIEPEEGFVESNTIPNTTLKFGKFKATMGKHNTLHTHAYPFIDAPLAHVNLLGDEGLVDVGLSSAILLPIPWFSEVTLQYLRGEGENSEFSSPTTSDGVGLAHWKNLFDLTDALTFEIGASYARGENSLAGTTTLTGADLTFKWRPTEGGKYHSLSWTTEYLARNQSQPGVSDEIGNGLATWVQYQFAERWATTYRYDNLIVENSFDPINLPNDTWSRNSVGLNYIPTEFSSYKLEFNQRTGGIASSTGETTENALFLQANFTIGAHPSHAY